MHKSSVLVELWCFLMDFSRHFPNPSLKASQNPLLKFADLLYLWHILFRAAPCGHEMVLLLLDWLQWGLLIVVKMLLV